VDEGGALRPALPRNPSSPGSSSPLLFPARCYTVANVGHQHEPALGKGQGWGGGSWVHGSAAVGFTPSVPAWCTRWEACNNAESVCRVCAARACVCACVCKCVCGGKGAATMATYRRPSGQEDPSRMAMMAHTRMMFSVFRLPPRSLCTSVAWKCLRPTEPHTMRTRPVRVKHTHIKPASGTHNTQEQHKRKTQALRSRSKHEGGHGWPPEHSIAQGTCVQRMHRDGGRGGGDDKRRPLRSSPSTPRNGTGRVAAGKTTQPPPSPLPHALPPQPTLPVITTRTVVCHNLGVQKWFTCGGRAHGLW
jgi:hypothetical protein